MTKRRALEILHRVWGCGEILLAREVAEIDPVALHMETPLATVARIAGIKVDHIAAFDNESIYWLTSRAMAFLDIAEHSPRR